MVTAFLTFVPVIFIHPVRVKILRELSLAVFAVWALAGLTTLALNISTPDALESPVWVDIVIAASGLYLFSIGFILQLLGKLR
jgi:phosphatidylcholine synthase